MTEEQIKQLVQEMSDKTFDMFRQDIPAEVMKTPRGVDVMLTTLAYSLCRFCIVNKMEKENIVAILRHMWETQQASLQQQNPSLN